MKLRIFCVRDAASEQYGTPMFLVSVGQAVRSFTDEVNRKDMANQMYGHPDDFDLWLVGSWDMNTCEFEIQKPEQVSAGRSVKIRE